MFLIEKSTLDIITVSSFVITAISVCVSVWSVSITRRSQKDLSAQGELRSFSEKEDRFLSDVETGLSGFSYFSSTDTAVLGRESLIEYKGLHALRFVSEEVKRLGLNDRSAIAAWLDVKHYRKPLEFFLNRVTAIDQFLAQKHSYGFDVLRQRIQEIQSLQLNRIVLAGK